jgi:hypothetical protein
MLQAIEKRLESQIDRTMETIESGISALSQQVTSKEDQTDDFCQDEEETFERHFEKIERKIKSIVDVVGIEAPKNDDSEDRKRLKEKLKEAMKHEEQRHALASEPESWMEYIFGICKPDGRIGKGGSRYAARDVLRTSCS